MIDRDGQGTMDGGSSAASLRQALQMQVLQPGMPVPIAVAKYDGRQRFLVETSVVFASPALLILRGDPGRRFVTATEVHRPATVTLEYFPVGRWYNIVSFFAASTGRLERHFCNIMTPATWADGTLSYIDLDLDLCVGADGQPLVEDVTDFRRNARRWHYPAAVRSQALAALRALRLKAAQAVVPFVADPFAIAAARANAGRLPCWVAE